MYGFGAVAASVRSAPRSCRRAPKSDLDRKNALPEQNVVPEGVSMTHAPPKHNVVCLGENTKCQGVLPPLRPSNAGQLDDGSEEATARRPPDDETFSLSGVGIRRTPFSTIHCWRHRAVTPYLLRYSGRQSPFLAF